MLSLWQLEEWINDVNEIQEDITVSLKSLCLLEEMKEQGESFRQGSLDALHLERQLLFTITVQLCKLFVNSDIERRNLRKLINRLTYDPYHSSLKNRLRKNRGKKGKVSTKKELIQKVTPFIELLNERKELVHRLKTLRDRKYVHTDPARELPKVKREELEELVFLSQQIMNSIKKAVL